MTQPNPTPTGPWLDCLRQDLRQNGAQDGAQAAGGLPPARFTRRVLAAWDARQAAEQADPFAADPVPEPWLEHLAASAHAPKPEAFVQRAIGAFTAFQTQRRVRRRTLGRLAFAAASLAAAAALVVGLRPWETQTAPLHSPPSVAVVPDAPAPAESPSLLAPLQASAQNWLERQSRQMGRQMQQQVTATLAGAKEKTRAILDDYAAQVKVSRFLLAPVMPALMPAAPAAPAPQETPPSPGNGPSNGLMVRPDSWLG